MIPRREIDNLAGEWRLAQAVVEKDYVLGWLLAGIARHTRTTRWAFKGGTCLRKCWFETYRFSEDLDFTVAPDDLDPELLAAVFGEIGVWLDEVCGLAISVDERSFRVRRNKRGEPTIEGRIAYRGPLAMPTAPKVKLDLTADEVIARPLAVRPIHHPFSDDNDTVSRTEVVAYSLTEVVGEKLRALTERCRPRDLYDVVHTHRHPDLIGRHDDVAEVLALKCAHAGVAVPTLESMRSTPFRAEIESEWANMLAHQLPHLPDFEGFWTELDAVFGWLNGEVLAPALDAIPSDPEFTDWRPARHMTSWRTGAPIELIRFAGANHLRLVIDYRPERGSSGPRVVEPYALRRSRDGHLLVVVVNDREQFRTYRADRIRGVTIDPTRFEPRFQTEF